ncbi:MAG: hypothetical protein ABEJ43_07500 [Haloferacaceae archaeon]
MTDPGLLGAIRIDLRRLHASWMELLFPRQLEPSRVLGKWTPETTAQQVGYYGWAALGVPLVAVGYPLLLLGLVVRFNARQLDSATARLGLAGVVVVSLLAWGALTAAAWLRDFSTEGLVAVAAAGVVATVAAAATVLFHRVGGRGTSVVLAYPAGTTALFLPPVVAALYSPVVASVVFPGTTSLAVWLLDNVFALVSLAEPIRAQYTLEGVAYAGMWVGIAVPLGWFLGLVVAIADLVRPTTEDRGDAGTTATRL